MLKTFSQLKRYANRNERLRVLDEKDIRDVQQALLEMMDDFHALCERNGLCYFLTGGTALGAVRNQGFIPWDDDIDLIMPRRDYDRLRECVDRELSDRYWIQSLETSDACDLPFSKFRKKGTKYVEIFENEPERAGLFIDVFPLEDMYSGGIVRVLNGVADEALFLIASCVRMYNKKERLLSYVEGSPLEKTVRLKAAIGKIFSDRNDRNIWFRRCEAWQSKCSNPDSKYVTVSCGRGHYFGETYLRSEIFPVQPIAFEGRTYWAPKNPDHLLTVLYGSGYMTPEDPSHREVHSLVELDLGPRKEEREYDQSNE